jgi:TusA-related sulfurtransferase
MAITFDRELDVRGAKCPVPVVKARQSVNELQVGQVLRVLATDPGSVNDFQGLGTDGEKHRAGRPGEPHYGRDRPFMRTMFAAQSRVWGEDRLDCPSNANRVEPTQADSIIKSACDS